MVAFKRRPKTTYVKRRAVRRTQPKFIKRKSYNRPSTTVVRAPSGIPDTMFCKLRYSTALDINNSFMVWYYGMNTPRKPDHNTSPDTQQPTYFDNYSGLYDKYICYGSSIQATFINTSSGQTGEFMICPSDTTSHASTAQDFRQSPKAHYRLVGVQGSGKNISKLYGKMTTKKILGLKYLDPSDSQYYGTSSVDPSTITYWLLATDTIKENATLMTGKVFINITYYIKFYDRKFVTDS